MKKPAPKKQRYDAWICILFALVTLAVYWPVRTFQFLNFDDPSYVFSNPKVFHGLTREDIAWAFTSTDTNWHPITWLSHMLDCDLFGHDAGLHHMTSLVLHISNTLLLFLFFRRLTGMELRSAVVAGLFALHPLHVESVAWIAERKDVLSTFFGLLAFNAYLAYAAPSQNMPGKRSVWYAITLLLFALSLMSKAMLVTFPFLLLLLDFWPLKRLKVLVLRPLLLEKVPFLLLTIADSLVTYIAQKSGEAVVDEIKLPFFERLTNAVMAYCGYLRRMVLPLDLAPYYPYRHHVPAGEIILGVLFLAVITWMAVRFAKRKPYLIFGWFWYLGVLVPVVGLVQVGSQSLADRYTYLPLVGMFVMIVWGVGDLLAGIKQVKPIAGIAIAAILILCAFGTFAQVGYWHDSETLFRRDLALFPENNATGHHCLGRALYDRGEYRGALPDLEAVVNLVPELAPGHLNLANCLSRLGRFPEAIQQCEDAKKLKPEDPEVYKCLGSAEAAQMKLQEARADYLTAVRLKPDYVEAYTKLATTEMALGKTNDALKHLTTAVAMHPDYPEAQYFLAHLLQDEQKLDEAISHFQAALKANADYADAMNDLARLWLTQEKYRKAHLAASLQLAKGACALTQYKNSVFLETLGMAFSESGDFSNAVQAVERAGTSAAAEGNQDLLPALQKELAAYRSGRSLSTLTAP